MAKSKSAVALIEVCEDVYYISDHQNYGVLRVGARECVVVDTGLGKESAQLIMAALGAKDLKPIGIINTHSHADHYGGNCYIVDETGCKVYAPPVEAAIIENPILEPFYIYGANPPHDLMKRFLMGTQCRVDVVLDGPEVRIGEKTIGLVPLDGHSPRQTGVLLNNALFCGDSVFSELAWDRLTLVYAADIGRMIKSIERLRVARATAFVPSHAEPTGDISELADLNLTRIQLLADDVLEILEAPGQISTVLAGICEKYGLTMKTLQQYYLSLDTVKAYITYLYEQDLLTYEIAGNKLFWRSTG